MAKTKQEKFEKKLDEAIKVLKEILAFLQKGQENPFCIEQRVTALEQRVTELECNRMVKFSNLPHIAWYDEKSDTNQITHNLIVGKKK